VLLAHITQYEELKKIKKLKLKKIKKTINYVLKLSALYLQENKGAYCYYTIYKQ